MRILTFALLMAALVAAEGCDYRMIDPRWKALADAGVSTTPGEYRSADCDFGFTDAQFARALPDLKRVRIEELSFQDARVTDESIAGLIELRDLRTLHAIRTDFTADGLARLGALPRLKLVYVPAGQFTEAELSRVRAAIPGATIKVTKLGSARFRAPADPPPA